MREFPYDYEEQEQNSRRDEFDSEDKITFNTQYSQDTHLILQILFDKIRREMNAMELGECVFHLDNNMIARYSPAMPENKPPSHISFKTRGDYDFYNGNDSEKLLFIDVYNRRLKTMLQEALKEQRRMREWLPRQLTLTKEDSIDNLLLAVKLGYEIPFLSDDSSLVNLRKEFGIGHLLRLADAGAKIDTSVCLSFQDFTNEELLDIVKEGYGLDLLYEAKYKSFDKRREMMRQGYITSIESDLPYDLDAQTVSEMERFAMAILFLHSYGDLYSLRHKLEKWIEENPERCLLSKNRNRGQSSTLEEVDEDFEEEVKE